MHVLMCMCHHVQNGLTPLMLAVKENRTSIVEKLLDLGASVNEKDKVNRLMTIFDKLFVAWLNFEKYDSLL